MALLHAVLDVVQHEFAKKEPVFRTSTLTPDDIAFLDTECGTRSTFDPQGWRYQLYQKYKKQHATATVRECDEGRVIVISEERISIPWGLWGRILRLYKGNAKHATQTPRIFLLASPHLRRFPTKGPIGPEHINGGYTYTCNNQTIMIYRAEDATRVLIHELQHASCLDHQEDGVDLVEAETEAWAELMYVALLSKGIPRTFQRLLQKQVDWMLIQNQVVRESIHRAKQFPWRYTIGKEDVWRRWGLIESDHKNTPVTYELRRNAPSTALLPTRSLRLTAPPSAETQRAFHTTSNVL